MALKTLGQARPASGTTASLYQVPLAKAAVVANIIVINTDPTLADDFILYQVPAAGTPGVGNAIFMGNIPAKESYVVIAGISLAAGESLQYYSAGGRLTFTCSGDES